MTDKPYSFRLESASPLKEALDNFLSNAPDRKKSQQIIQLIRDGLISRGLFDANNTAAQIGSMEDLRNDLRYELESTLKGFVLDLLKDSGRMSTMHQISEDIANGGEIDDDVIANILEGFSKD